MAWVEISGFPEYEVHPKEGIRNKKNKKLLKGRTWFGYPKVTLMRDGKKYEKRVHRIIAEHFLDNPNNYPIVNHKDSDRSNFSIDNLEWVDNSGNQLHRWKTQKDGLNKIKYEMEYGKNKKKGNVMESKSNNALVDNLLGKNAKVIVDIFDNITNDPINKNDLSNEDKLALEKLKSRGPGFRGVTNIKLNGVDKKVKVSVNDSDRVAKKGQLYKETKSKGLSSLSKKSVYDMSTGYTSPKRPPLRRVENYAEKLNKSGPLNAGRIGRYFKIGAGLAALAGLATLSKKN